MSKIDNVILMNLDRREDKYQFALGVLHVLGFPTVSNGVDGVVKRWVAYDGNDYDSVESVQKAAVDDGFDELGIIESKAYFNNAHIAWCWTWRSVLRSISLGTDVVLLMIDDFLPTWTWNWHRIDKMYKWLYSDDEWRNDVHGVDLIQLCHFVRGDETDSLFKKFPTDGIVVEKGLCGICDAALILSPKGAEMLLEYGRKYPYGDPEVIFSDMLKDQSSNGIMKGVWHTIDNVVEPNHTWDTDLGY